MTSDDLIGLLITGVLGLFITGLAIVLLLGKGSFFIAGYNTMSKREKAKVEEKALCRFIGKILLPIGLLSPVVALGGIYQIAWLPLGYGGLVLGLVIFAGIYCNTGGRFQK